MKIFRGNTELIDVIVSDNAVERKELMMEHCVTLNFSLANYLALKKGDKVQYKDKYFYLNRDFIPIFDKETGGYQYDLVFYDITERFKDFKLKYNQGIPGFNFDEMEFYLTSDAGQMLDVVIACLNKHNLGTYTKGIYPTEFKDIFFQNVDIFSALTQIAEAYESEWWIDDSNKINIGKFVVNESSPVVLEHDKEADDITFSKSDKELVTRLYAFGGTRNLPKNYRNIQASESVGQLRLRMRNDDGEPIDYIDFFPNGALPENQIVESVQYFDDIFPLQNNKIIDVKSSVISAENEDKQDTTVYQIKGDNSFTINEDSIVEGKPLMISFLSGRLTGREFELIIQEDNWFEIRYKQEDDRYFPNPTICPKVSDTFFFANVKANVVFPDIIPIAEKQLFTKANEWLNRLGETYVYDVPTRSIYCEKQGISLDVGDCVTLKSEWLGEITSRVRKYEKSLQNEYEATYSVSDNIEYSRLANLEKSVTNFITGAGGIDKVLLSKFMAQIKSQFLSRMNNDQAQGLIKFFQGIEIGDFTQGFLGGGGAFKMNNGKSELEVDKLTVRMMATFFELVISKLSHIGGQLILTPARMKCTRVEEKENVYRCYFERGENNEVDNEFVVGDQARCQIFSGSGQKYYWRLVTATGSDWIELSKTDKDGDSVPAESDDIVQLGNRNNAKRQNAIILSTVGSDAPSYKQYSGIDSYSLEGKEKTVFSPSGNKIVGSVSFESGSTGLENIEEFVVLSEEVEKAKKKAQEIEDKIPLSWELVPISDKGVNAFNYGNGGTLNQLTYSVRWYRSGVDVTDVMNGSSKHLFDFERKNIYGVDDNDVTDEAWNAIHKGQTQIVLTDEDINGVGNLYVVYDELAIEQEYQRLKE